MEGARNGQRLRAHLPGATALTGLRLTRPYVGVMNGTNLFKAPRCSSVPATSGARGRPACLPSVIACTDADKAREPGSPPKMLHNADSVCHAFAATGTLGHALMCLPCCSTPPTDYLSTLLLARPTTSLFVEHLLDWASATACQAFLPSHTDTCWHTRPTHSLMRPAPATPPAPSHPHLAGSWVAG